MLSPHNPYQEKNNKENANIKIIVCDTPEPWGLFFQDNATPNGRVVRTT